MKFRAGVGMEASLGFEDWYRLSVHAVITNSVGVLLLKATYGEKAWGLPGGALDPGETIHEGLLRECAEELGSDIAIRYLSGVYAHSAVQSHAFIFRCELLEDKVIRLSSEHSDYAYFPVDDLPLVQRQRVLECIGFNGRVRSARF
jgi:8-oxo-dGTP diphosphatase